MVLSESLAKWLLNPLGLFRLWQRPRTAMKLIHRMSTVYYRTGSNSWSRSCMVSFCWSSTNAWSLFGPRIRSGFWPLLRSRAFSLSWLSNNYVSNPGSTESSYVEGIISWTIYKEIHCFTLYLGVRLLLGLLLGFYLRAGFLMSVGRGLGFGFCQGQGRGRVADLSLNTVAILSLGFWSRSILLCLWYRELVLHLKLVVVL